MIVNGQSSSHDLTRDSDNSGMRIWDIILGKSPRLAEILAKGSGNLEWVFWEEDNK